MRALHRIRMPSAVILPAITEGRGIGRDRNRSTRPCWKSSCSASAVVNGVNARPWIRMPGSANWRYSRLEPVIAPPKT